MTYTIKENNKYNSREVYFDSKPQDEVLFAIKGLGMRWNHKKSCWYGFASESALIAAIQKDPESDNTVITDGHLGGGAVYGSKSGQPLYGADLSAAVRADIKKAGFKGVFVSCKSYSGGQSLTITIKLKEFDFVPEAEFLDGFRISNRYNWIYDGENTIYIDEYYSMNAEEQEALRKKVAKYEYKKYTTTEQGLNQYRLDSLPYLKPEAVQKIRNINNIVAAYRYDDSNSMVDYFDTNFYYDIYIKPDFKN